MSCTNCFSGCTEITADKCVKYTGENIELLGVNNGDPLPVVVGAITTFLESLSTGEGTKFDFNTANVCDLVKDQLSSCCSDITLKDIVNAILAAVCSLDTSIEELKEKIAEIDIDYTTDCLTGVDGNSSTGAIIQAAINKICSLSKAFSAIVLDLQNNYVKKDDIPDEIQDYLNAVQPSTPMREKMVPYVAVEYYGPLSYFDSTGAGIGDWEKIYLCNGRNNTPDKRGRIPVGAIQGMAGLSLNPDVDPQTSQFNPNYGLLSTAGANSVTLSEAQLPSHTHEATASVTIDDHSHFIAATGSSQTLSSLNTLDNDYDQSGSDDDYHLRGTPAEANIGKTSSTELNASVEVELQNRGGGEAHSNIPPVLACYYIIYLP